MADAPTRAVSAPPTTVGGDAANPYLAGNFAPVLEEVTATDLAVEGALPPELDGRYLRNGPNPVEPVDPATYHWFSGSGMVHGVRLRDGRAEWYRNRWVRGVDVALALGEEPPPSPYPPGTPSYSANTNVVAHAGRTLALVEGGSPPVELTDTLETVGPTDFDGTLDGPFSAHPKRDPDTGELHLVAYYWAWGDRLRYMVVDVDGRVRHTADVAVPGQPMVHDLAITRTRALLFDLPCTFSLDLVQAGVSVPYGWNPDYGARVGVLPLGGRADEVVWCEVEPCYVFHPLNAYDAADGSVVVDVVRHDRMFDHERRGPADGVPRLERWTVDPAARAVRRALLDDRGQELPRVDERVVGRRHRYGYTMTTGAGFEHGPLLKHDLDAGRTEVHDFGPGRGALEPVFVPRSPDAGEDDGWVLAVVYDATRDGSDLVVLAAQDFTADPVATVRLPRRVPFGFHGNWVPTPA